MRAAARSNDHLVWNTHAGSRDSASEGTDTADPGGVQRWRAKGLEADRHLRQRLAALPVLSTTGGVCPRLPPPLRVRWSSRSMAARSDSERRLSPTPMSTSRRRCCEFMAGGAQVRARRHNRPEFRRRGVLGAAGAERAGRVVDRTVDALQLGAILCGLALRRAPGPEGLAGRPRGGTLAEQAGGVAEHGRAGRPEAA